MTVHPYQVVLLGAKVLPWADDPIAVLEASVLSLESILNDLAEHGKANAEQYGFHTMAHFRKMKVGYVSRIRQLRRRGERSAVHERYVEAQNALSELRIDFAPSAGEACWRSSGGASVCSTSPPTRRKVWPRWGSISSRRIRVSRRRSNRCSPSGPAISTGIWRSRWRV